MSHSILPPSGAGIWGIPRGCTGWVKMMASIPSDLLNVPTPDSIEGDAAHELCSAMIQAGTSAGVGMPTKHNTVGGTVTDEMFEACELYADDVIEAMRIARVAAPPYMGVEQSIPIYRVHKECFGTPDCFIYDRNSKTLYLWDFKYGHVYVDEYENYQAICYVAGLLAYLVSQGCETAEGIKAGITVKIRIVQPRVYDGSGPIREWLTNSGDLAPYIDSLNANAQVALSTEANLRTGSHCRYCDARAYCTPCLRAGLSYYEMASGFAARELSPEAMSLQYSIIERAKEQIEAVYTGFKEQIKYKLMKGEQVPGYGLKNTYARERWAKPVTEVISMGDMFGVDLRNTKAATPNQARKLGIDDGVIAAYSEKPQTGYKLIEADTKSAKKIFTEE